MFWENTKTCEDRRLRAKGNLLLVKYLEAWSVYVFPCKVLSKTWNKKRVIQLINLYFCIFVDVLVFFKLDLLGIHNKDYVYEPEWIIIMNVLVGLGYLNQPAPSLPASWANRREL